VRAVVILLAMLALTGCATTAIPKAATAADVEAFLTRQLDAEWADTGLSDDQRPDVSRERFISNADFTAVMSECTVKLTPGYHQVLSNAKTIARLVYYTCQAMYPVNPNEYQVLSTAQIDYLYDYYGRWVLPCLRARGYDVGATPSRAEFRLFNGLWNPIYHSGSNADLSSETYQRVSDECHLDVLSRFPKK
jgi:hypothetical protein